MEQNQNQETSTVSKRMTGKVKLMGPRLGGARRGKVFTSGRFQVT